MNNPPSAQPIATKDQAAQTHIWRRFLRAAGIPCLVILGCSSAAQAATWYLHANQPSWEILTNWYSEPLGAGTNPAAISADDEFDINCFQLRTKTKEGETFGGKKLILTGGEAGLLNLRTVAPAVCVIPNLESRGGKIQNFIAGTAPETSAVEIKKFSNTSNTTLSPGSSARGLEVAIGELTGDGDLTAVGVGGGAVSLDIGSAANFHGTLYVADGCHLTFKNAVVSSGALNIDATAQVTLDSNVTFSGLTVGREPKPAGVYSAASLSFGGTGSITVKEASATPKTEIKPAGKPGDHLFGVNFPGGGFATAKYHTDPVEWDYYHSKGLNLIRVAFLWERVQPTLRGDLDASALEALDSCVALAAARGMKVILDMHNYDRYPIAPGPNAVQYLIGTPEVPYEAYKDVWKKLAAHFESQTAVYGYDIMNEPHATNNTWPIAAQAGVDGVRESDKKHYVIVEGDGWASATNWMKDNGGLDIKDPAGRIIYSAHIYWDNNYSGRYDGTYVSNNVYPNIGVDRTAPFVHWLKLRKAKGFVGEYGIPANVINPDLRWYPVLDHFLAYLAANDVSGTYWAAGNCWSPGYKLQIGRLPVETQDPPVLSILQKYGDKE